MANSRAPQRERNQSTELDRRFMAAAVALGRRHSGLSRPAPSVGAIMVMKSEAGFEVIARAVTGPGGQAQAEAQLLAAAGPRAKGATVYLTMEPRAHSSVGVPSAELLVRAGVAHVVTAINDPDPKLSGRGHALLTRNRVVVTTGVLADEGRRLHAGHIARARFDRPHVNLSLAISADGCIGREGEGQLAISCPQAKAYTLGLRVEHDAILIGVGTVVNDDPQLTNRLPGCDGRNPVRVILDAEARTPLGAKLVASAGKTPTWVFVAPGAPEERVRALTRHGVLVEVAERDHAGRLDLGDVLFQLGRLGITSLISEGGARVARALIESDHVDEATLTFSDIKVGAGGVKALAGLPLDVLTQSEGFAAIERRRLGVDRLVRYWRAD
jgi:diaminohydroxyphosphoribosylaminopyrimidine deaminase/5-amino-6-(5-phosphoribosylamino)uracil reductase